MTTQPTTQPSWEDWEILLDSLEEEPEPEPTPTVEGGGGGGGGGAAT